MLAQGSRLTGFLEVSSPEYDDAAALLHAQRAELDELLRSGGEGSRSLLPEEDELWSEWSHTQLLVHLRIETYYVFATMLLDKLGQLIETYYGQGRSVSQALEPQGEPRDLRRPERPRAACGPSEARPRRRRQDRELSGLAGHSSRRPAGHPSDRLVRRRVGGRFVCAHLAAGNRHSGAPLGIGKGGHAAAC
jgi:hypothetical protein